MDTTMPTNGDLAGDAREFADAVLAGIVSAIAEYRRRKPCLTAATVAEANRILLDRGLLLMEGVRQLANGDVPSDIDAVERLLHFVKSATHEHCAHVACRGGDA